MKIQDGGGRRFEKSKTDISPPWFEQLRQNWHSDAVRPSFLLDRFDRNKFKILKIQYDGCRHLEKSKIKIYRQWVDRSP